MLCFTTYSVYSLNFSGLFPQQSEYLMMITLYFLLSICWTFISMIWFIICNHYITTAKMPKPLYAFARLLQRLFCCCFSSSKTDNKTEKKAASVVEDGEFNEYMEENIYRIRNYPIHGIEFVQANDMTTSKCKFCKRCKSCQADFDKDKVKDKKKKDIEVKCGALNYLIVLCVSILMFISNMVVWLLMSR